MHVEFRDKYEPKDYSQGVDLIYRQKFSLLPWLVPIMWLTLQLVTGDYPNRWTFLMMSILGLLALLSLRSAQIRHRLKNSFTQALDAGEIVMELTDKDVTSKKDDGSLLYSRNWTELQRAKEDQNCFALIFQNRAFIIPKRFLSSDQVTELRSFLTSRKSEFLGTYERS